jgi:diguanylate cyclase (GGDEF)-like protein/PAS domain S-box-containing protein
VLVQRQQQRLRDAFDARGRAQEALGEEKEFFAITLGSIDDGVITLDNAQRITFLNRRAEVMTGWTAEAAQGRALADVVMLDQLHLAHGSRADIQSRDPVDMAALGANAKGVAELTGKTGQVLVVEYATMALAQRHSATHSVLVLHDVSQATQMAHTLSYQASHDALTGLLNRTAFDTRVELALESAAREEREHVLLFLDLDQFKVVNDSCGHAAGDELLKQVAFLFMQVLRQNDMLARMGGDEFAILLQDCPASAALRLATKLRAELTAFRFAWADKTFQVGVSIGAVPINAASGNRDELMRRADAACYIAKDSGRNRTHLYLDCDEAVLARRGELSWAARVQRALAQDEFVLQGQRIVSPQGGPGHYYEMLVRLREPDGTLVPPMAFLPAAERYGLMPALDRAVIDKALEAHSELRQSTCAPVKFGINLSGASLSDPALFDFIKEALERHQVTPECVCFELTETVAIANLQVAARLMGQLRELGCSLALDDFGSGMSSFSYLKQLPVDVVKIDGSFVRNMLGSSVDYAMVEAVNNIAHQMGMVTLAEYVETPALMAALEAMGVDLLQGYGVGKPESLEAMHAAVQGAPSGGARHVARLRARA